MAVDIQWRPPFTTFRTYLDITMPCGKHMLGHLFCAFRAIDIQLSAPHYPWNQNEIRKPGSMVGMQMSNKRNRNLCRIQRGGSLPCGGGRTAHNTGTEVYEVRSVSHHDSCCRARAVWKRARRSRAKKNNFGSRLTSQWQSQQERNCKACE